MECSADSVSVLSCLVSCVLIGRALYRVVRQCRNGVEAFPYCLLEGAVGDETVTLARQQSTDIFFLVR